MFAKSKRFQEGTKEYIPGPGEYNIPTGDDLGRHKRYGFLNQTNRFNGEGPVEISPDFFAGDNSTASLSSETRFSSVSTSSNKTEDARTRRQMSELATQFEKYRHSMQKEIEALQLKNRKMEATVQSMTLDKETTQSTLLKKDQELASIRQENLSLQKSLGRLEKNIDKSPKVIRLQKRLDQMENELQDAKDALIKAQQAAEDEKRALSAVAAQKDETIGNLTTQIDDQAKAIDDLHNRLRQNEQQFQDVRDEDKRLMEALQSRLDETMCKLAAADETLDQKEQDATALKSEIQDQQQQLNDICTQKITLQSELAEMKALAAAERHQWTSERTLLQHEIEQLDQNLNKSAAEITHLGTQLAEGNREISNLREKAKEQYQRLQAREGLVQRLHVRFDTYQRHVTQVMQDMKERMKSKDPRRDVEIDRLTRELREAKKFINKQALHLDGLKSELHWMSRWNRQLNELIDAIHQDDVSHGFIAPLKNNSSSTTTTTTTTASSSSLSSSSAAAAAALSTSKRSTSLNSRDRMRSPVKDTVPRNDSGFSTTITTSPERAAVV